MTAVTENAVYQYFAGEVLMKICHLTVTSDETYTPTAVTGKTPKVVACYNGTDGAVVKTTYSGGVFTLGNAQSLSDEDTILTIAYIPN